MGPDVLIEATALARRFDARLAVDSLTLTLTAGRVLALLGPNGAGKTTSMRMLAGLLAPSAGTARVCGMALAAEDGANDAIRARCGVVPEAPGFYERLSARQNLRFFGGLHGLSRSEVAARSERELCRFGLEARGDDRVATFSKGMKQRLSLARALLHRPRLLFLDEPTAGLDPQATAQMHERIRELARDGAGIVLSTHNLEEAEALADDVLMLDTRPLYYGPSRDLCAGDAFEVRIDFAAPPPPLTTPDRCRLLEQSDAQATFAVADPGSDTPRLVAALVTAGARIVAVGQVRHGLRQRYLELLDRR
jgi:ABC-2 type transport system ATP-binding protein